MRIVKTIGVIFVILLALGIAGLIGGYGFIQSQSGRNTLANIVNRKTATMPQRVVVTDVTGDLLGDFTIGSITLSDANGVWLSIDRLHVIWQPLALLRKAQGIDLVQAGGITILRRPEIVKKPPHDKPKDIFDPSKFSAYIPRKIAVDAINLHAQIGGHAQTLTLHGSGKLSAYHLDLATLAGPQTILRADTGWHVTGPSANIVFDEAMGGLVSGLLFLPEDATIHADARLSSDTKGWRHLDDMHVTAGATRLDGSGTYDPAARHIVAALDIDVSALDQFQHFAKQPLAGDIKAHLALSGPFDDTQITLDIQSDALSVGKTQLDGMTAQLDGAADVMNFKNDDFVANAKINTALFVNNKATELAVSLKAKGNDITIDTVHGVYDGYAANGGGTFNRVSHAFDIHLASEKTPLNKIMPSTKRNGQVAVSLTAEGDFDAATAKGSMALTTDTGNSTIDFMGAAKNALADFNVTLTGDLNRQKTHFDLAAALSGNASHATVDTLQLTGPGVAVNGKGGWQKADKLANATLSIDVTDFAPLGGLLGLDLHGAAKVGAVLAQENGVQRADVALARLQYTHDDLDILLARPTAFKMVDKTATLSPAVLSVAGGTLTIQGNMSLDTIGGTADLRGVDVNKLVRTGLQNIVLNGRVTLSGRPASPAIVARTTLAAHSGDLPLNMTINGDWRQNKLHVQTDAKARAATARVVADFAASLSLKPFKATLNKTTPLSGNIAANVPLAEFNTALWPRGHRINGNFGGNARLTGTVGAPQVLGRFVLDRFDYDNPASGVCLRNAHAIIDGSTKQVTLHDFTARDPRGGTFNGNMQLTLAAPRPVNGALAFRDFRLFCGGLATGTLDGRVGVNGSLQAMAVTGKLRLGPLNVQIPAGRNKTDIPEVETVRIVPGGDIAPALKPANVIRLDVSLDAPSQVYVRGRGLDAEFGGNLHIGGTATAPDIRGVFASRRGRFTLLDRVMRLQRAVLRFEGPIPPAPYLDVSADTDVQSTTITVNVTGPAARPAIALVSSPARPQDETLALLLFGRTLRTISPFQAYQLAQATRELAGLDDGGPGLLDRARGVLGVDTLDVGTDDENNVTVTTGKYITDKVYVGVQQGTTPESREVTTQIELTPNVNANTTLDADGNQGVGVGWKWDY